MRRRRSETRSLPLGAARIAGSLIWLLWARAARRPVDSFAVFAAVAASVVIVVNALVLQSGSRPAPFVANAPPPIVAASPPKPELSPPSPAADARRAPEAKAPARNDPIAQLIGMSSRIMAVQRALSDYGYGQIRPSGILDEPTSEAIEKFEHDHDMPVTGRISDRLVNELAAMIGRPLQ